MAWAEITELDIRTRVSAAELKAYRETAATDGSGDAEDLLPRQIQQVAVFVRRYVFSCRSNYEQAKAQAGGIAGLGTAYAIPESLLHVALGLIVPVIQGRVGGYTVDPEELRKDERASSLSALKAVANGETLVDENWPLLSEEELADLTGSKGNETPRITPPRVRTL